MTNPIEAFDRATGMDIFRRTNGPGGFKIVIPGVAVSADNVQIDRDQETHEWVLSYEENGLTYVGRAENLSSAYLCLIAARLGV